MPAVATPESVSRAAEELQRQGESPSVRRVQDALGGGSTATIQKYLKQWREELARRAARDRVPSVLRETVEQVWDKALHQAAARFEEDRDQ